MTKFRKWLVCQALNGDRATDIGLKGLALHIHFATPGGIIGKKTSALELLSLHCGHPRESHEGDKAAA